MLSEATSGLNVAAGRTRSSIDMVGAPPVVIFTTTLVRCLMTFRNGANASGDWSGRPSRGSRACKCTIAAPASAAPIAASAISVGVIGRCGDMVGVWIDPVTAQVMITRSLFAIVFLPSFRSSYVQITALVSSWKVLTCLFLHPAEVLLKTRIDRQLKDLRRVVAVVGDQERFQCLVFVGGRLGIKQLLGLVVYLLIPPIVTGNFLNLHAGRKASLQNRPRQLLRLFLVRYCRHDHAGACVAHRYLHFLGRLSAPLYFGRSLDAFQVGMV